MPYKIFICYRRADKELARAIEQHLTKEFGTDSVFLDIEDIHGGQKWKKSVSRAFKGNPIVVTLITTRWNSQRKGKRKLLDSDDHVRFELETALGKGLTIIPVVYDRARFPSIKQIPSSLHPLLGFQNIPFSNERWEYDSNKLVGALKDLVVEEVKEKPSKITSYTRKPLYPGTLQTPNPVTLQTPAFKRSMFTESTAQRESRAKEAKLEEERLARIRAELPAFYERPAFWIAVVVTFALSAGSVFGAEVLVNSIGIGIDLPDAPLMAGILLASVWSIVWIAFGAAEYSQYPEDGPKVFYTHGILGGWVLGYDELEPIGYWAAFPISTAVLWLVARGLAMLALYYLQWNYLLVFWIVLGVYTLPVLAWYSLIASEDYL